jgi:hypothetical protein
MRKESAKLNKLKCISFAVQIAQIWQWSLAPLILNLVLGWKVIGELNAVLKK